MHEYSDEASYLLILMVTEEQLEKFMDGSPNVSFFCVRSRPRSSEVVFSLAASAVESSSVSSTFGFFVTVVGSSPFVVEFRIEERACF